MKYDPKYILLIFEGNEYKILIEKLVTLGFISKSGNKIVEENTLSADRSIDIKLYKKKLFHIIKNYKAKIKVIFL